MTEAIIGLQPDDPEISVIIIGVLEDAYDDGLLLQPPEFNPDGSIHINVAPDKYSFNIEGTIH